jgi:hypothetical protein
VSDSPRETDPLGTRTGKYRTPKPTPEETDRVDALIRYDRSRQSFRVDPFAAMPRIKTGWFRA